MARKDCLLSGPIATCGPADPMVGTSESQHSMPVRYWELDRAPLARVIAANRYSHSDICSFAAKTRGYLHVLSKEVEPSLGSGAFPFHPGNATSRCRSGFPSFGSRSENCKLQLTTRETPRARLFFGQTPKLRRGGGPASLLSLTDKTPSDPRSLTQCRCRFRVSLSIHCLYPPSLSLFLSCRADLL